MTQAAITKSSTGSRVGWWLLMALAVLAVLNHASLIFVLPGEEVLFIGWTAFSLYAALVLYGPYRRGERWAWFSTWIMVLAFAAPILFDADIGLFYLGAAVLMALGQFLTRGWFFSSG